jgi:hypothetical protein
MFVWFGLTPLSVILWRSVLLVEETRVPGENHKPVASHWQTWSHNVVSSTLRLGGVQTHNISGDRHRLHKYCKSNYIVPYNHDHNSPFPCFCNLIKLTICSTRNMSSPQIHIFTAQFTPKAQLNINCLVDIHVTYRRHTCTNVTKNSYSPTFFTIKNGNYTVKLDALGKFFRFYIISYIYYMYLCRLIRYTQG